jgi:two-component system nitrate/nitrite response regulator NarL
MPTELSSREREVMLLICKGLSNTEIARQLNLSEGSVRVHLHNVFLKMAKCNRAALAALAAKQNDQQPKNDD